MAVLALPGSPSPIPPWLGLAAGRGSGGLSGRAFLVWFPHGAALPLLDLQAVADLLVGAVEGGEKGDDDFCGRRSQFVGVNRLNPQADADWRVAILADASIRRFPGGGPAFRARGARYPRYVAPGKPVSEPSQRGPEALGASPSALG